MKLKLKILKGSHTGEILQVTREKFIIGRAEDCHLKPSSDRVSRHHCMIVLADGIATIRDLGSHNGTFVNDERIIGEHELKKGDKLEVGPLAFEVSMTTDVQGTKKPEVKSVAEAATRTATSTNKDLLDIEGWLTTEEDGAKSGSHTDTTVMLPPQETVVASPAANLPAKESTPKAPNDDSPEAVKLRERAKRAQVANAKAAAAPTGDGSRGAASDALKKMFKRR